MTYDIYYHNDFDGRASAAVMLAFLRSRGDMIKNYIPVNFDIEKQWPRMKFPRPGIVVDFVYHPQATWYFDHHLTSFRLMKPNKVNTPNLFWDKQYPSCTSFVLDTLREKFDWKPPVHFKELAQWLDITDAARFKSAKQAVELKEPALQLMSFVDWETRGGGKPTLQWLVELMSRVRLKRVAADRRVKGTMKKIYAERDKAFAFYKNNIDIIGRVSFIDLSNIHLLDLRFTPYFLYPNLLYNVMLKKVRGDYKLSVGSNPWKRSKVKINVGLMLKRYGGGGHKAAGGLTVKPASRKDRIIRGIIAKLNK